MTLKVVAEILVSIKEVSSK